MFRLLLFMAFAQLTYREGLSDIEVCLRAQHNKLYHMGIRGGVARNTLANANKKTETVEFTPILPARLSQPPATLKSTRTLASISTIQSTHLTHQPSLCVCPYSHGLIFAKKK